MQNRHRDHPRARNRLERLDDRVKIHHRLASAFLGFFEKVTEPAADGVQRRGGTPTLVLLTDGRANVARDGQGGRTKAGEEAMAAARLVHLAAVRALLVDTSPHPQPKARELAVAMGASYLPLPYADANLLSQAVQRVAG